MERPHLPSAPASQREALHPHILPIRLQTHRQRPRGGSHRLLLLGDIYDELIAGLHPLNDRCVPLRDAPDILLPDDLPVVAVRGGKPVCHKGEFEG